MPIKYHFNKAFFTFLFFNLLNTCYSQTWQPAGPDDFNQSCYSQASSYPSIKADVSGNIYAAYSDGGYRGKLTVTEYKGSSWAIVGTEGFSATNVSYVSLALDTIGVPYVAFKDGTNNKFTVMKFDGGSWVTVGPPGISTGYDTYISLAIDSNNTPYIAYADVSKRLTVMKYNGISWATVGIPEISTGSITFESLAIANDSIPYIAFVDGSVSNKATVMKYSGGNWSTVGNEGFTASTANYTSLVIDKSGNPYVAFADGNSGQRGTVMKYNGSTWAIVASAGFTGGTFYDCTLAIDANNNLYMGYQDGNSGQARVMEYNGSSWSLMSVAGFTDIALNCTLAIDAANNLYIGYEGGEYLQKIAVKQFANNKWNILGAIPISIYNNQNPYSISSVKDNKGNIYIAYDDDSINVRKYNNGVWSAVGSAFDPHFNYPSMVISNNNTLYLAYDNFGKITVASYNGNNWATIGIANSSTTAVGYSIAIDKDGSLYLFFADGSYSSKGTVMKYDGSNWATLGTAGFTAGSINFESIAIDSSNIPYIAFGDNANSGKVTVMKFIGGNWVTVGPAGISDSGIGNEILIAIANDSIPYVAFGDESASYEPTVMKYSGGTWSILGNKGITNAYAYGVPGYLTSMIINTSGFPFVSVSGYNGLTKATVLEYSLGSWKPVGNPGFTAGTANNGSLVFDNNSNPFIVYDGGGLFAKQFSPSLVVPLTWLSFNAHAINQNVVLSWSTSNEANVKYYIVQYSIDEKSWKTLSTVPATESANYNYTHMNPIQDMNYYRIIGIDLDGNSTYSIVKAIQLDATKTDVEILNNNPIIDGILQLQINKPTTFILMSVNGQVVLHTQISSGFQTINVSNYAKGIYILKSNNNCQKIVIN